MLIASDPLVGYASLATKANEPVRALHLLGCAIRLREEIGGNIGVWDHERRTRTLDLAQRQLSRYHADAELAAGRAIGLQEAVAYALEEEDRDRYASDQVDQSNRPISRPPADT